MAASQALRQTAMRAIRVMEFGGPSVLKLEVNIAVPQPTGAQVLIKVGAAGVNPVDTYIRAGTYAIKPPLPYTPGHDTAGVVEAVGPDVDRFKIGDHVYTLRTTSGGYAEYACAEQHMTNHLHSSLSFSEGCAIGVPYCTAYYALVLRGKSQAGETVMIHGASGGVGIAAVQIAKFLGLKVIGTAGSTEGMALAKKNGADAVFNHREAGYLDSIRGCPEFGKGPDIIVEMLANVNLESDLDIIKFRGRIVCIGSRGTVEITPRKMMGNEPTITGIMLFNATMEEFSDMHRFMASGMQDGWLKPQVGKEYPLEKASDAQEDIISTSAALGKIVLKP